MLYTAILLIIIKVVGMSHVTKPPQCDLGSLLINLPNSAMSHSYNEMSQLGKYCGINFGVANDSLNHK